MISSQTGLKLARLLPRPHKCWACRHVPPLLAGARHFSQYLILTHCPYFCRPILLFEGFPRIQPSVKYLIPTNAPYCPVSLPNGNQVLVFDLFPRDLKGKHSSPSSTWRNCERGWISMQTSPEGALLGREHGASCRSAAVGLVLPPCGKTLQILHCKHHFVKCIFNIF